MWSDYHVDVIQRKNSTDLYNKYVDEFGSYPTGYEIHVIPVNKFKTSLDRSREELEIPHVMTPMEKFRKGIKIKTPGFGAEKRYKLNSKYADKIGKGYKLDDVPAFIYHQLQRTTDGIIKLKSLIENTIAKLSKNINVKIDIDKTNHAQQRQHRHEEEITDSEIINIVNLALPDIANELMFDKISMGSYVLIKQKLTNINIVGVLYHGQNDEIDFIVVTVMKKENFIPKKGTKVINV